MNLSIDTWIGVTGVILTITLGYYGLKYTLKYRKKTKIMFLKNSSISLFKTIVKNLDDIEINFQGKKIDENLILFKGTFFNNGNIDIEKSIVHKPLEIQLPENFFWIKGKVIDSSNGLDVTSSIINDKLIFEWDLFKEGEYFTFDSLVEYKSNEAQKEINNLDIGKQLVRNISINHRITDLKKVKKENFIPDPTPIGVFIMISLVILGLVYWLFTLSFKKIIFPEYTVVTEIKLQSGNEIVDFKAYNKDEIVVVNEKSDQIGKLNNNSSPLTINSLSIRKQGINYWTVVIFGLLCIVYFIMWVSFIIGDLKQRKLFYKLKTIAAKYDTLNDDEKGKISSIMLGFTRFSR